MGGHSERPQQREVRALERVVAADAITGLSKKVKGGEDYQHVATISANGDEHIGNLMAAPGEGGIRLTGVLDWELTTRLLLDVTAGRADVPGALARRLRREPALPPHQPLAHRGRWWRPLRLPL